MPDRAPMADPLDQSEAPGARTEPANGALRILLARSGVTFSAAPDELVLDAAYRQGIYLPHNCLSGQCRTCITRVLRGRLEHDPLRASVLNIRPDEVAAGWRLLCSAYARSDAALDR